MGQIQLCVYRMINNIIVNTFVGHSFCSIYRQAQRWLIGVRRYACVCLSFCLLAVCIVCVIMLDLNLLSYVLKIKFPQRRSSSWCPPRLYFFLLIHFLLVVFFLLIFLVFLLLQFVLVIYLILVGYKAGQIIN